MRPWSRKARRRYQAPDPRDMSTRLIDAPTVATATARPDRTDARYPSGASKTAIQPAVRTPAHWLHSRSPGANRRHPSPGVMRASRTTAPALVTRTRRYPNRRTTNRTVTGSPAIAGITWRSHKE